MWPRVPRSPRARGRSSARPRRPLLVSPQLPPNVPRSEHRTACRCRRPHLTRGSPGPCPRPGCPTFSDIWKRLPWATRGGAGADPGAGTPRARGGVGARFRPAWLPQRAHGGAAGRRPSPAAPGPGTGSAEPRAPPRRGGEGPGLPVPGTPEDCRPAAWRREGRAGCPGAAAPRARREAPARPAAGFPVGTSVPRCVSVCVCGALTLPVAGTVLVPMAGLGLLLVPALLPAPPPRSFLGWGPRPCSGRALGTREPRPAGPPARRRGSVSSAPALPAGRRQGVAAAATGARRTREPLTAAAGPVVGAAARGGPPRSTPLGRGSAEDTGRLSQSAFLQGGFRCEGGGQGTAHPLPAGIQAGVVASEDPAARSPEDSRLVGRASLAHRTLPQRVAIPAFISCARVQSNHSEPRCLLHVAELHDAQTPRERAISCDKLSSLHIRLTVSVTFSKGDKPSLKMGR